MSIANVERFFEIVQQDEMMKQRVLAASDREAAIRLAVELGSERGLSFTESELEAVIRVYADVSELSEQELAAVAGGLQSPSTSALVSSLFKLGKEDKR